jgi:hypothetical protein
MDKVKRSLMTMAGVAGLALGGAALADAASNSAAIPAAATSAANAPPQGARQGPQGRHVGANGSEEQALPSAAAAKVAAAAKAKVPGATLERTETDVDHGSPYEAHLRKADGTELEVLVNKDFQVTAVNTMRHP